VLVRKFPPWLDEMVVLGMFDKACVRVNFARWLAVRSEAKLAMMYASN
jgi:hypothetical protein